MTYQTELTTSEVNLTSVALDKMKTLMSDADDDEIEAVRVFVTGGGCAGMSYGMTFTNGRTEFDSVLELDGVKVYVDAVALNYLKGVEIDFVEQGTGASFVFNNVFQATGGSGTCGACGAAGGGCA